MHASQVIRMVIRMVRSWRRVRRIDIQSYWNSKSLGRFGVTVRLAFRLQYQDQVRPLRFTKHGRWKMTGPKSPIIIPHLTLQATTARELMSENPISLRKDAGIRDAIALMMDRGFTAAPVIDDSGRPIGVVSVT